MRVILAACVLLCLTTIVPTRAADDLIERLATCQVSWFDWKDDAVKSKAFLDTIHAAFAEPSAGAGWTVKSKLLVVGLPVTQAFPQSVGMGVGFSVMVDATFDIARAHLEKAVGKSLKKCESGDGMRTCELEVADKRTLTLMSGDDGKTKTTLMGCYYFYEK